MKSLKKIIDYDIITANSCTVLKSIVKRQLQVGWQPFGSMTVQTTSTSHTYCQTLVQYENTEEIQQVDINNRYLGQ